MDPAHVLWIGGATGAGKSSIAGTLAHGHDLQLYNVDHRTYIHVERARVPPDVRWDLPPSELAQRFLDDARDRFELVLEDLAELPDVPGAIAEGPFLLPSLVPFGAVTVFLVPTEQRIKATAARRGQRPVVVERTGCSRGGSPTTRSRPGCPSSTSTGGSRKWSSGWTPTSGPRSRAFRAEAISQPSAVSRTTCSPSKCARSGRRGMRRRDRRRSRSRASAAPRGCREVVELSLEDYLSVGADRSTSRPPRT